MTQKSADDYAFIARRLKEIKGENPDTPIVTDKNPPDYVEPTDPGDQQPYNGDWYDPAYP